MIFSFKLEYNFVNEDKWGVDEAYKAYGETVYDFNFLDNFNGRVWILDTNNFKLYEKIKEKYSIKLLEQKSFSVEYKGYQYSFSLLERVE